MASFLFNIYNSYQMCQDGEIMSKYPRSFHSSQAKTVLLIHSLIEYRSWIKNKITNFIHRLPFPFLIHCLTIMFKTFSFLYNQLYGASRFTNQIFIIDQFGSRFTDRYQMLRYLFPEC